MSEIDRLIKASSLGPAAWIDCPRHGHTARDPYRPSWCVYCLAEKEAPPPADCDCGHKADWHLQGPESWGECDAMDCECAMYSPWEGA
jgi:hypothetical protein